MNRRMVYTGSFSILALLLIAMILSVGHYDKQPQNNGSVLASWAISYESLEDINKDSSIAVLGKVEGIKKVDKSFPPQIAATFYKFKIDKIFNSKIP